MHTFSLNYHIQKDEELEHSFTVETKIFPGDPYATIRIGSVTLFIHSPRTLADLSDTFFRAALDLTDAKDV